MTTTVEQEWLGYAWSVVNCRTKFPEHFNQCQKRLSRSTAAIDPNLRWPGTIGRNYQPGASVLFVGSVHREFHIGPSGRDPQLERLEQDLIKANRDWVASGRSPAADNKYLSATQASYEASYARWPRGRLLTRIMAELGDQPADVAWANLAKCQASIQSAREDLLQAECATLNGPYPVRELIELLDPAAVFIPVIAVGRPNPRHDFGIADLPNVFIFDGRKLIDAQGRSVSEWRPEALAAIRTRRRELANTTN